MIVSTLLILVTARFMSYVYGDCIEMKEVKKHSHSGLMRSLFAPHEQHIRLSY